MKKKSNKINVVQALSNATQLPLDLLVGYPYMQIYGNREIVIEGVYGISKYNDDCLCVNISSKKLSVCGKNLRLDYLNNKNMSVKGYITGIEFE